MADPVSFAISTAVQVGINFLFPSEGPRMKDLRVSASTYSNIMPEVWGRVRVAGNMIWSSKIREKKTKQFGKGGFSNQYTYFADFAISWCKGPITDLRRIWADGKIIYDATGQSEDIDNGKYLYTLYTGTEEQMPDPVMSAALGEDSTPAFRGQCYVMFENFALEDFGNRIPQFAAEIYAGEPSDQAATTLLTPLPSGVLSPGVSRSMVADFDRGYFYTVAAGPGHGGLHRYRMADGAEDREIPWDSMVSPVDNNGIGPLLGVWPDGSLLLANAQQNNSSTVYKLDGYSYTVTAQFGLTDNHVGSDETHITAPANAAFCTSYVETYCLVLGAFGSWTVLGETMDYMQFGVFDDGAGIHANRYPAGRTGASDVDFFVFSGGDSAVGGSTSVVLSRISKSDILHPNEVVCVPVLTITSDSPNLTPQRLIWDQAGDAALMFYFEGTQSKVARWSVDTQTVTYTVTLPANICDGATQSRVESNQLAFMTTGVNPSYYILNTLTGDLVSRALVFPRPVGGAVAEALFQALVPNTTTAMPLPNGAAQDDFVYDSGRQVMILYGGGTAMVVHVGQYATSAIGLDYIVETLLRRGGLAGGDFDLSALKAVLTDGYGFASSTDVKGILAELKQIFLFDLVEIDGVLKAVVRGGDTAVETINALCLGSTSPDANDFWKETRVMENDLPAQIVLSYMNIDDDFQSSTAPSKRASNPIPVMYSFQQVKIEASIAFDATSAQQRSNAILYAQWAERTKHNTRLPLSYAYLDPTDLITVNLPDGRSYFERIHSTEVGADYAIVTETYGQDSGAYLWTSLGDGGGSGVVQTISTPKPALPFIFNLPLLRDMDDSGGGYSRYYAGVAAAAPGAFNGATVFRSINKLDYDVLYSETADVEWGVVVGKVPPPAQGCWSLDWETQITIAPAVSWFELESVTDDELNNLANLCVIGGEVLCFRDCVENDDGTWTIWNLLRGQRGTEWATDSHKIGERFVFLSNTTISLQGDVLTAAGQSRSFKAVGTGRSINATPASTITYLPRDLMPYAPTDIQRTIDEGSGDITVTWARRTRMGGGLMDATGTVPLNETSEAYEVYILDEAYDADLSTPTLPSGVLRKLDATSETVTYTASQQTEDGVTNLDTLHLVIYQISSAVGRGFPGVRSIEPSWQS